MRLSVSFLTVVAVLMASSALAGPLFTDPTQVNLLERWKSDGTYYYVQSSPNGVGKYLSTAQHYKGAAIGLYSGGLPSGGVETTVVLGSNPVNLGLVTIQWRDYGHTPTTWEIWGFDGTQDVLLGSGTRDEHSSWTAALYDKVSGTYLYQNNGHFSAYAGEEATIQGHKEHYDQEYAEQRRLYDIERDEYFAEKGTYDGFRGFDCTLSWSLNWSLDTKQAYAVTTPVTNLTLKTSGVSGHSLIDLPSFGAYLAQGETLAMDGTFNVFREEIVQGKASVETFRASYEDGVKVYTSTPFGVGNLTDGTTAGFGLGRAGAIEWTFSQEYAFNGALISKYENTPAVMGVVMEVSNDGGKTWEVVFGPEDVTNANGTAYLAFTQTVTGDMFRLSWDDTIDAGGGAGGGREIHEFQLFGKAIPEPATMGLLVLGGLALLRRRRA